VHCNKEPKPCLSVSLLGSISAASRHRNCARLTKYGVFSLEGDVIGQLLLKESVVQKVKCGRFDQVCLKLYCCKTSLESKVE
jgi:hypothetical protein